MGPDQKEYKITNIFWDKKRYYSEISCYE